MLPSPSADTSSPLSPSLRFFIVAGQSSTVRVLVSGPAVAGLRARIGQPQSIALLAKIRARIRAVSQLPQNPSQTYAATCLQAALCTSAHVFASAALEYAMSHSVEVACKLDARVRYKYANNPAVLTDRAAESKCVRRFHA